MISPSETPNQPYATWPTIGYGTLPLRRILVVQTQRLGDVLCATPLYAALRHQFPDAYLAALVHSPMDDLLRANPHLNEIITYDRQGAHRSLVNRWKFIAELKQRGFDWALVIHAASSVAFALWQAGVKWRTCVWRYGDRLRPHWARMYHQHVRQDRLAGTLHEIEHNLNVLRELQMEPPDVGYGLYLKPDERTWARSFLEARGRDARPLAVIHPGHGGGRQAWPSKYYSQVGDGLVERGWQVAITGSGRETELVERVSGGMQAPSLPLAGGMSLRQFAAVLAEAGLFVSVSTGPMHLASASGVPTVTLYGPTDLAVEATRFCPYGSLTEAVRSPVICPCPASKDCTNPVCMTGMPPSLALAGVDRLFRR